MDVMKEIAEFPAADVAPVAPGRRKEVEDAQSN